MRALVISDIHGNLTALEAVLNDAGETDEIWCLGDMVGYGPDPNEVVEKVRGLPNLTCLLGNHDMAAIGKIALESFNGGARQALEYHMKVLKPENMEYMNTLPSILIERENASLVHGSPRDTVWEYILNTLSARLNFAYFTTPWCMVGHSHLQCMFKHNVESDRVSLEPIRPGDKVELKPRLIMNPGSVGQPRDRDARAAYAIYDSLACTWEPRRATYDIEAVQKRIRDAGLPEKHAVRIAEGW